MRLRACVWWCGGRGVGRQGAGRVEVGRWVTDESASSRGVRHVANHSAWHPRSPIAEQKLQGGVGLLAGQVARGACTARRQRGEEDGHSTIGRWAAAAAAGRDPTLQACLLAHCSTITGPG